MPFTLKDYSDIKELAKGGMSRIYLATQISLNRKVVIKEMAAGLVTTKNEIKRFENEAQAGASLSHDNIIRIYDFGEERGSFYIAMEFVDGLDLDQLLKQEDFPREIGMMILQQALKGLAYAHEHAVVHRDVKAANILVARNGAVKVVDFGLAYAGARSAQLTSTGAIVGTPVYMSPELVNGEETKDACMDIWAAGVLLYRLVTGEFPFTGENVPSTLITIVQDKEKPAEELDKTLPHFLAEQLHACLEKDHTKRLPAFMPLIQALQDYFFELGVRDPIDMIKKYLSDKGAAMDELQSLLVRYHRSKGDEFSRAEKHATALAHYREARKRDPKSGELAQLIRSLEEHFADTLTTRTAKVGEYVMTEVRARRRGGKKRRFVAWSVAACTTVVAAGLAAIYLWQPGPVDTAFERIIAPAMGRVAGAIRANFDARVSPAPAVHDAVRDPDTGADKMRARMQAGNVPLANNSNAQPSPRTSLDSGVRVRALPAKDSTGPRVETAAQPRGLVRVLVNPVYAEVKIDNGETMTLDQRSDGKWFGTGVHQVIASAEGFASVTDTITVAGNDTHFVMLNLMPGERKSGELVIYSDVASEMYVDGEFKGNTPITAPIALREGQHTVVFKRPGYKPYEKSIYIKSGETSEIKVESGAKKPGE
jgi:serine/threonine protein kinase